MEAVYVGQKIEVTLDATVDVTDAVHKIKALKPDETPVIQEAEMVSNSNTKIVSVFVVDTPGDWKFYTYIKFGDDPFVAGIPLVIHVYNEGEIPRQ